MRWYNLWKLLQEGNFKTVNKEMHIDILRCCRDGVGRKMENQQLVSSSQRCSSTPVRFGQGFLSKELCDNTGAFLHTPVVDVYPFPGL
jgi:hypothetical protein